MPSSSFNKTSRFPPNRSHKTVYDYDSHPVQIAKRWKLIEMNRDRNSKRGTRGSRGKRKRSHEKKQRNPQSVVAVPNPFATPFAGGAIGADKPDKSPPPKRRRETDRSTGGTKPVTLRFDDIWTVPNLLLPSLQSQPWVRFLRILDGSHIFPKYFYKDPEKYDVFLKTIKDFAQGLLLNPPFSIWDKCAEFFLDLAVKHDTWFVMIAPNQPKYDWHPKWYQNTGKRKFCRLDLQNPLAYQQGPNCERSAWSPSTTSLFFLGLDGPNGVVNNHSSGYIYPNLPWLRQVAFNNKLNVIDDYLSPRQIKQRLEALKLAEKFRENENVPSELLSFVPPPLPEIVVSTSEEHDSIYSADKKIHLARHFCNGCKFTSRQVRQERRTVRTLGEQLRLYPKGPKGFKRWMKPIPPVCSICQKKGHPPQKCTKRLLREDECIFSNKYEHWLFRYVTYEHKPYYPQQRPANMGLLLWFEKEMTRIHRDAAHFRKNFVLWVRQQTGNHSFHWKDNPTFSFSEVANAVDFWAAIGAPKFLLQRFINGFRVELTNDQISFEVSNDLPPEKEKELFELHTKPFLESRKACLVPPWFPQVVLSRFLVEEPTKKRPILDGSPLTQFTVNSRFELPPPSSHERYMPRGFLFTVDAKGCFCNIPIRIQDRKYLCFWDATLKSYVAYNHAAFGFAAGPEYADTLMSPIVDWMKHGFSAALWIDDIMAIFDKLDMSAEECSYLLTMMLEIFKLLRIRLNKKCILMPKREVKFTGVRLNSNYSKLFADTDKLFDLWDVVRSTMIKEQVPIVILKKILGKSQWFLLRAKPNYVSRLQQYAIETELEVGKSFPRPHDSITTSAILRSLVPVPPYLLGYMNDVLKYVESHHYALSIDYNRPQWFVTTDVGEREAGGFGYTRLTNTQYFNFSLPQLMWPDISTNNSKDTSSSIRELWGINQVIKHIFRGKFGLEVGIRVDNSAVVSWLNDLNPAGASSENKLLGDLIGDFAEFCEIHSVNYIIDHHPRERPAAQFADFLSKLQTIHKPWNTSHLIKFTKNGISKLRHFRKKFRIPSPSTILAQNEILPWRDMLCVPQPWIKPINDLLQITPVLCIPYGLHRKTPYMDIIDNLIRYQYTGIIVCPAFSQALNIMYRYFSVDKDLYPGRKFHFIAPTHGCRGVMQHAFFMSRGMCC